LVQLSTARCNRGVDYKDKFRFMESSRP
jgi:hypothetical protein